MRNLYSTRKEIVKGKEGQRRKSQVPNPFTQKFEHRTEVKNFELKIIEQ